MKTYIVFGFLLLIFLTVVSCTKEPEIVFKYDGNWSGTTSQNEPISFTIKNDKITFFAIKITHATGRIEGEVSSSTPFAAVSTVNGNTFSFTVNWSKTIQIEGTFDSLTSCKGTYNLNTGSGTWETNKD